MTRWSPAVVGVTLGFVLVALAGALVVAGHAAAETAGRTLMVAFNNRYRPDIRGLKSFISSGELGDIFTLHGTWFNRKVRSKRPTWRHRRESGGGAFMDLGVQVLDLCPGPGPSAPT